MKNTDLLKSVVGVLFLVGVTGLEPTASSAPPPLAVPEIFFSLRRKIPTAAPFSPCFFCRWQRCGENAQSRRLLCSYAVRPNMSFKQKS